MLLLFLLQFAYYFLGGGHNRSVYVGERINLICTAFKSCIQRDVILSSCKSVHQLQPVYSFLKISDFFLGKHSNLILAKLCAPTMAAVHTVCP